MEKRFFENFSNEITKERLSVYRADGCDDTIAIARYLYNIELCKSLYPSLNIFEIAFRNSLDKALQKLTGITDWFDKIHLNQEGLNKVNSAKKKINNCGKQATHDRVISELTLGFWTSLFSKRYAQEKFQPFIIRTCFKDAPKSERSAISLWNKLDKFRFLRNRVFHYERLIHWKDLKDQHTKLLEFTQWLAPNSFEILSKIDEFEKIYNAGMLPTTLLVGNNFNPHLDSFKTMSEPIHIMTDEEIENMIIECEKNAVPDEEIDFSDLPELTEEELRQFRPVHPEIVKLYKSPVTVNMSRVLINHFKSLGGDWQEKLNDLLMNVYMARII